jgi:hypothetical protein
MDIRLAYSFGGKLKRDDSSQIEKDFFSAPIPAFGRKKLHTPFRSRVILVPTIAATPDGWGEQRYRIFKDLRTVFCHEATHGSARHVRHSSPVA